MPTRASIDDETALMMDDCWSIPDDPLVEILLRVPPISRRRLRLVRRRHWRKVIDERTPETKTRAVLLAFVGNEYKSSAHLVGERFCSRGVWEAYAKHRPLDEGHYVWWAWEPGGYYPFDTAMVGTCNGLLCVCDNTKPGGAITLANPVTKETLPVPRLPGSAQWDGSLPTRWHEAYSFAYHPVTGRYKIVHVPCCFDLTGHFGKVQVFTLGEASWRDVPAPAACASCCVKSGIVSVDGATYWVNKDTERVVTFDLADERIAATVSLPFATKPGCSRYLTEVRGRLGVVEYIEPRIKGHDPGVAVWVLGDGTDQQAWNRRYRVQVHELGQRPARPLFVHGQQVLRYDWAKGNVLPEGVITMYGHLLQKRRVQCSEVRISKQSMGMALTGVMEGVRLQTFAYVETTEPLSVYKL